MAPRCLGSVAGHAAQASAQQAALQETGYPLLVTGYPVLFSRCEQTLDISSLRGKGSSGLWVCSSSPSWLNEGLSAVAHVGQVRLTVSKTHGQSTPHHLSTCAACPVLRTSWLCPDAWCLWSVPEDARHHFVYVICWGHCQLPWCIRGSLRTTCETWFSFSIMWLLEIKLGVRFGGRHCDSKSSHQPLSISPVLTAPRDPL